MQSQGKLERLQTLGELPCKMDGAARRKLGKEPLIGTKILFCGRGLKSFSPLNRTNSETIRCHIFFLAQYPKRKSCLCGAFEAEHPNRY